MISKVVLASALALASPVFAAEIGPAPGKLGVTFEADAAVATGVTPGATVAWLGVSRSREDWSDHFYHWRLMAEDSDKDGVVTYPRKEGFPQMTVLVAVDLTTGAFGVGTTYPLENDVPSPVLAGPTTDAAGLLTSFSYRGPKADLLVVRPGAGAWSARVLDGGPLDGDGVADGTVTVSLAALPSRGGMATRLDGIRAGDVIAMIDASGPSVRIGRYAGDPGKE